jgi:hypothetical protein
MGLAESGAVVAERRHCDGRTAALWWPNGADRKILLTELRICAARGRHYISDLTFRVVGGGGGPSVPGHNYAIKKASCHNGANISGENTVRVYRPAWQLKRYIMP